MALFCFLRSAAVDFLVCLKTDSMLLSPQQCKAFVLLGRLNSRIWVGFLVFLEDHLFPSHKPVGQGTCSRNFCQTFLWVPSESYKEETTSGCSLPLREIHFPQGFQTFSLSFTNSLTILAKLFNAQQHPFRVSKSSQFISPCRWLCSNFGLVGGPVTSTPCDFKNSFRCVVCFCKNFCKCRTDALSDFLHLIRVCKPPAVAHVCSAWASLLFPALGNFLLVSVISCSRLLRRQGCI